MNQKLKNAGFSLTEVLMAIGIFSVAMIFIAGAFPVAIHFTTIASEQTIAAVVADEAFAKIRLYRVNPSDPNMRFNHQAPFVNVKVTDISPDEFAYPSDPAVDIAQKQYYWSAICRRIEGNDVQVTVFVSRKIGAGTMFRARQFSNWPISIPNPVREDIGYPAAMLAKVQPGAATDEIVINDIGVSGDGIDERAFINDGYTIVEDSTGQVYRVLQRYVDTIGIDKAQLDKDWNVNGTYPSTDYVWVIPPPVNGSRYPCVGVFQKVIRF